MKKIFLISIAILFSLISCTSAFSQITDCGKSNIQAINQSIREKTYQYIKLVKDKKNKVNQDSIIRLAKDYIEIQTNFNTVFKRIMNDRQNLASKKLICERYSDTLGVLIKQAIKYDNRISIILEPKPKINSFGASDVLDIIDWIFKKVSDGNKKFYEEVKWKDWDEIK